jgi:hypothetical protein
MSKAFIVHATKKPDSVFSAVIAKLWIGQDAVIVNSNDLSTITKKTDITGSDFILVKTVFNEDALHELRQKAKSVTYIGCDEHHLKRLQEVDYDDKFSYLSIPNKSSAIASWQLLFSNEPIPLVLTLLDDAYTGKYRHKDSNALRCALTQSLLTEKIVGNLLSAKAKGLSTLIKKGKIIQREHSRIAHSIIRLNSRTVNIDGIPWLCINSPCAFFKDCMVKAKHNNVVVYYDTAGGRYLSFRSVSATGTECIERFSNNPVPAGELFSILVDRNHRLAKI